MHQRDRSIEAPGAPTFLEGAAGREQKERWEGRRAAATASGLSLVLWHGDKGRRCVPPVLLTKAAEVPHLFKLTAAKIFSEVENEALKEEKVKFWC